MKALTEKIMTFLRLPLPREMCERLVALEKKVGEMNNRVTANTKDFLYLKNGEMGFPGVSKDTTVNILTYILEDDEEIHTVISQLLREQNFSNFQFYADPERFLAALTADINICVIDHFLTGTTGLEMIKKVKEKNKNSYVIVVSGQRNFDVAIQYLNQGADKYIDKNNDNYIETLINYLKDGVGEASRRAAIVKFLEEKIKQ